MGTSNLTICARYPDVVVTAACDVWDARLETVTERYKDTCKGYSDYREMLKQKNLDAVIIGTPPHWHALQGIAADPRSVEYMRPRKKQFLMNINSIQSP